MCLRAEKLNEPRFSNVVEFGHDHSSGGYHNVGPSKIIYTG